MFTLKDIERKNIFVVNGLENHHFKIKNGFLWLEEWRENEKVCKTKFPIQKILFLLIIGHTTVTTAVLDKCNKAKVPVVVMKPNFRCTLSYCNAADGNYLIRRKQHLQPAVRIDIAQRLIGNKMENQLALLKKTRIQDDKTTRAIEHIEQSLPLLSEYGELKMLMGAEGVASRLFFESYYQKQGWKKRQPRIKIDPLNALLDIGYTFLFNYIESMCRLFGFDLYVGVYHQLFFKRKSLVCDLVEPFRCIIDHEIRKGLNSGRIKLDDFEEYNKAYYLKSGVRSEYTVVFMQGLIQYKQEIFIYIQQYYRFFMNRKSVVEFPQFKIK
ncbi:MAG: type V CRISPR-associated endonuclease Cas1 [Mangrovibacterium sp.]